MQDYINTMFPQASLSTRTDTAATKPPVFHSEIKRREHLQHKTKSKTGNFLKGKRKNVSPTNSIEKQVDPCRTM